MKNRTDIMDEKIAELYAKAEELLNDMPAKRKKKVQKKEINSLKGKCLVYIGDDAGSLFHHAVVYITESTADVVKGIIINKLLFGTAAIECKTKNEEKGGNLRQVYEDLYQGGPENPAHGFVLFPKDDVNSTDPFAEIQGDVAVSTSFGILQDILDGEGPSRKIIAMGHCVWHKGELEWEIFNNQWLIVPGDLTMMFDTAFEDRWRKAKEIGGYSDLTAIQQVGFA